MIRVSLLEVRDRFDRKVLTELLNIAPTAGTVVVVDRDSVFSHRHLSSAVMHAARSILSGRSRAKDQSMEVLRYIAGSRQVGEGSTLAGPGAGTTHLLFVELPPGWPGPGDGDELPGIEVVKMDPGLPSVEPMRPEEGSIYGGTKAVGRVLGTAPSEVSDPEKAILEKVALADLS